MNENKLLDSARRGDDKAFREIVRRYEAVVARTIKGMLGDCAEAEDIGQEVFVRFYSALNSFRGDSGIATYLTRIAINLSINELKRRRRKLRIFSTKPLDEYSNIKDLKDSSNIEREEIIRALDSLDAKSKAVIVLRLINGYSTEETASILGIPMGTVLSRLSRAQKKLMALLQDHLED